MRTGRQAGTVAAAASAWAALAKRMSPRSTVGARQPWVPSLIAIGIVLAFSVGGIACRATPDADPRLRERVLTIDAHALSRVLELTATLEGTPLATLSRVLLESAEDCSLLFGHRPSDAGDPEQAASARSSSPTLECVDGKTDTPELARFAIDRRGDSDGLLLWPLGEDGRLELRLDIEANGTVTIDGTAIAPSDPGVLGLLVPSEEAPAQALLTSSSALVHGRIRPAAGLGLARFLSSGGQADRMFALKGRLLEGALLRGTLEFVFMPPVPGGEIPLALVAVDHRGAAPIGEALDQALSQLESTWPIRRSRREFSAANGGTLDGGCFLDLPLLPELAPCWLVTEEALLIGYRGEAIDAGLARPTVSAPPAVRGDAGGVARGEESSEEAARFDVHLGRIEAADRALLGSVESARLGSLYERLSARWTTTQDGTIAVHARLDRVTP